MKKLFAMLIIFTLATALVGCAIAPTQNSDVTPTQALTQTEVSSETEKETQVETEKETAKAPELITEAQAVKAALAHANLSESDITHLVTEFDIDDGVETFEVDFHFGKYEYDYEINAKTGEIISFDKDIED